MANEKLIKEIRLSLENVEVRSSESENSPMIIEGYPIVFGKEQYIFDGKRSFYEQIDKNAFANADMSDVCLKYNHNDNVLILARTRNGSLKLSIDEHGVFMRAELIDTTTNVDVYKMVKSELLKEGSFAFTVRNKKEERRADGTVLRNILEIGKLFDVSICPNGAYGDMTEIYARSCDLVETINNTVETETSENSVNLNLIRLRNKNKIIFTKRSLINGK